MAVTTQKSGSIVKKLLVVLAVFVVLLIVVYFVATSAAFFKGVILPRVSKSVGADITVADASISPFSGVTLTKLKVQAPGAEPVLEADQVVARYSLMAILGGNIKVDEATVVSPVIKIVEDENGKKNTDVFTTTEEKKAEPKKDEKPPKIDIKNVSLKNATVQLIKKHKDAPQELTEISDLNLTLDHLQNGQPGKLDLSAGVKMQSAGTNALGASVTGKFDFALAETLLPSNAKGGVKLDVKNASGSYADFAKLSAGINCDITPTEIKDASVQFAQAGKTLGEIRASGPFDANKVEGKLNVEVASIDRQVLNLFGASKGIDFGTTKINSTNQIEISKQGKLLAVTGALRGDSFGVTRTNQSTPKIDLLVAYDLTVDQAANNALVKTFTLTGTQNKQPLLRGALSKPMKLDWGKADGAVDESAFDLTVTNLNLADWKAFAPEFNAGGKLGLKVGVVSQKAGKKINFDAAATLAKLSAQIGSNRIDQADIIFGASGRIDDLDKVVLEKSQTKLAQKNEHAATINLSGEYTVKTGDANFQAAIEAALPKLFQLAGSPDMSASTGNLKFTGNIKQQGKTQMVVGDATLANFTGRYGEYRFDKFNAAFKTDVQKLEDALQIKNVSGTFTKDKQPGGNFALNGNLNSKTGAGQFDFKFDKLNENALAPFLQPSLGEKKLVSVLLTGDASATLKSTNDVQFKTDLVLTNLVVRDPKKEKAEPPLSARLAVDGGLAKEVFDLRNLQLTLSPTKRAKNQLTAKGKVDLSNTNAMSGNLAVNADALDLTEFYNIYGATDTNAPAAPAEEANNEEPEPMKLPVGQITADVKIGALYLREIAITNLQVSMKINGSKVTLNPAQLTLNGASVKANVDLDLGVRGYAYNVSFFADRIPLEPVANTFMPENHGQYKGQILATAQIKGVGTTGTSLKKSLDGNLGFTFTNANIQIVGPKMKKVLVPIATILRAPEITSSPVSWIDSRIVFGGGNIDLKSFTMTSAAFMADTAGIIPIADVLTNSPLNRIPVNFQLSRNLAEKAKLMPANTAADAKYVALPNLVKLVGTIGNPSSELNTAGLAGVLGSSVGGLIGGETGQLIQGIGGLLGGQPSGSGGKTNAATTNKTGATNKTGIPQVLDLFKKKK